ncbi:Holliday junction branch migration protein RuvA [Microbacterium rhizomatis]|uniref:Holliday junction branch migration complex subunit RuvA n=1 Tax=Microbacterium rhizomatis TaxID=1631477 RepID=A0A5J5J113_9MICO|nr:Holliday junction branch migration protein RuvA [Microbacterium rhizomatis]KAA9106539.1 Holliday junction branch migration protein RuvA [Microbacterium rhizomatis]
MISVVAGKVVVVHRDRVVVDVGGVGLEVSVAGGFAEATLAGDEVCLFTTLTVRQEDLTIYGFAIREELELFELMTSVPGVGAKIARSALSSLGYNGLVDAIRQGNEPVLRKVPGVGPRAAAMILLSLRPRLGAAADAAPADGSGAASHVGEAVTALQGLGWNKRDAMTAVEHAAQDARAAGSVASLIKAALALLGPE